MSDTLIGIDLGTSNCAVAYIDLAHGPDALVLDFEITQAVRPSDIRPFPLLPSAIYLPHPSELSPDMYALPWDASPSHIVGEFARWQGARVPSRLIISSKSWLSHSGVDRTASILPWSAPSDVEKISPIEASSRLLLHIRNAWNHAHPDAPLETLEVVITVPASFDEVARSLTVTAARHAGFEKFTLVEEPQAAFYDFTARHRRDLAAVLEGVTLVLVVDVGGGTSDFTLVEVGADQSLRRIAVGDHLMLGGDNMDAAIARKAEEQMTTGGRKLTSTQWSELLQASRDAKESLLSSNAPENYHLSVVAEGGRLIGGSMSAKLSRENVEGIAPRRFFPAMRAERFAAPRQSPRPPGIRTSVRAGSGRDTTARRVLPHASGQTSGCNPFEWGRFQFTRDRIAPRGSGFQLVAGRSSHSRTPAPIARIGRRARRGLVWSRAPRYGTAHWRGGGSFVLCRTGNQTRSGVEGSLSDPTRP